MIEAPWNASWTGEDRFEVRPCRYAENRLAMWQPHRPGVGRPIFAKPHFVRQRKSIAEMRCTVCGERTDEADWWHFGHGEWRDGLWMTQEAPVHFACAQLAQRVCPHIRKAGLEPRLFPPGYGVVASILGGPEFERDFGIETRGRTIIDALKLAWRHKP